MNLLDTPGIDNCGSLQKLQVQRSHGIVLLFDLSDRRTFDGVESWYAKLQDTAMEDIPIVLVGTKADIPEDNW